jgi:CubicO group peptidase (beta-lactamase class C family)
MKRGAREFCCLIVLCLALLVTHSAAKPGSVKPATSPPAIDFSELDKLVPSELKEKNTPGAVITILSGDQLVYQKAFGMANVETNAPMQAEMLFRLGSTCPRASLRS